MGVRVCKVRASFLEEVMFKLSHRISVYFTLHSLVSQYTLVNLSILSSVEEANLVKQNKTKNLYLLVYLLIFCLLKLKCKFHKVSVLFIHQCMLGIVGIRRGRGGGARREGKCHVWKDRRQMRTFVVEFK